MAMSECKEASLDVTDRLLYKLVRVEEDGTVIPASEDEVLQVESLMKERSPIHIHEDSKPQTESNSDGCITLGQKEKLYSNEKISVGSTRSEFIEVDKKKLLAQLVFLDALLHMLDVEQKKIISNHKRQQSSLVATVGMGSSWDLQCPSSRNKPNWSILTYGSSAVSVGDSSRGIIKDSQLDLLTGNVSLDKLSIRELHEAFRTTFKQHTFSKDKLCLKERIAIGSLETVNNDDRNGNAMFVSTDFFFNDDTYRLPDSAYSLELDSKLAGQNKVYRRKYSKTVTSCQLMKHKESSQTAYEFATSEDSGSTEKDIKMGSSGNEGKRKRRPTKRFIEELAMCDMKDDMCKTFLSSTIKGLDQESNKMSVSLNDQEVQMSADDTIVMSDTTIERTHHGGRGKTRKRRKNASTSGRAAQLIRKAKSVRAARIIGNPGLSKIKARPIHNASSVTTSAPSSPSQQNSESASKFTEVASLEDKVLSGNDENRKKQHHRWSLKEVVKLLDGVTHCGVGNWTDVKKFSFPNSADRSTTDLKDKWRNLVRASNRHHKLNSQRGENRRKHYGSFLPSDILIQVHELLVTEGGTRQRRGKNSTRKR